MARTLHVVCVDSTQCFCERGLVTIGEKSHLICAITIIPLLGGMTQRALELYLFIVSLVLQITPVGTRITKVFTELE
jgi:hypothetical protein